MRNFFYQKIEHTNVYVKLPKNTYTFIEALVFLGFLVSRDLNLRKKFACNKIDQIKMLIQKSHVCVSLTDHKIVNKRY